MVGVQAPPVTPPTVAPTAMPTVPEPPPVVQRPVYDDTRLFEVALTLAPSDFDLVRGEGRSFADVFNGCDDPNFEYTVVPTRASVDGEEFPHIGVRKRGFLGSLSQSKPSLKLDFDAYEKDLAFRGQKALALANSKQDPSLMHMCLAYTVFASAGLPTPRCSFAHVVVNGEDLGYYINIEPIKKPMLRRFFPDVSGNLYEGIGGADFVAGAALARFERKNDDTDPSLPELSALAGALVNTGPAMLSAVEPLVELDEFMRFWAIETIVGHWDGYTGGLNNYYLYANPENGKLSFIPWGTDATFMSFHPFLPSDAMRPPATYARGRLSWRLYDHPPTRDLYRATLGKMLAEHWNEAALHARLDAWSKLLGAAVDPDALSELRGFIDGRRAAIREELDAEPLPWTIPERTPRTCEQAPKVPITGTFDTTWGSDPEAQSSSSPMNRLEFTLDGAPQRFDAVRAGVGAPFPEEPPVLSVIGTRTSGDYVFVIFSLPDRMLTAGSTVTLQGSEYGEVYRGNENTNSGSPVGYITKGTITFDEIGMESGARVRGRFEGQLSPYEGSGRESEP